MCVRDLRPHRYLRNRPARVGGRPPVTPVHIITPLSSSTAKNKQIHRPQTQRNKAKLARPSFRAHLGTFC